MKTLIQILYLTVISFMLWTGCGEEATAPTDVMVAQGTLTAVMDNFMLSIGDTTSSMFYVYTPSGYDSNRAEGYPTVYMLNGFGGNENTYVAISNAMDAADWLLSRGDIEPMILVFPSGHNVLGGSFYTNSLHPLVGLSEDHIMIIVDSVDVTFNTIADPAGRVISGQSMGSYGAFSIALNRPNMFGGVAGIAGPLALWGTMPADSSYQGVAELMGTMLAETGYDSVLVENPDGDPLKYQEMMYPSLERRITSFMFAMAAAFSPTNPVAPGETTIEAFGVDLPIALNGGIHDTTWNRWLVGHDVLTRFTVGVQAANLAGVNVFLDAGDMDDLGLNYAHQVLAGAMALASMPPSYAEVYPSNPDAEGGEVPSDHTTHTFERIKKLLIWASDNF